MTSRPVSARVRRVSALPFIAVLVAACSGPVATGSPAASSGPRPSSPATIEILQPAAGSTVTGTTAHIVLRLTGATIVPATSTDVRPDQGHVHLYVNNVLVSMNYGLEQDIPVQPGSFALKAEFVAADHAPFSPRVWSPDVIFTVKG
jgi:hypothetical protein